MKPTLNTEEEPASGHPWKQILEATKNIHALTNDRLATEQATRDMQHEAWPLKIDTIKKLPPANKERIMRLNPIIDVKGLIRCGGRLQQSDLEFGRQHPILIPETKTGDALCGYLHSLTEHQGRKITSATIREQGYHPLRGNRRIRRIINKCNQCRQLRAPPMIQQMANLAKERLFRNPPLYHSSIDIFGPFEVRHGRTTRAKTGKRKI